MTASTPRDQLRLCLYRFSWYRNMNSLSFKSDIQFCILLEDADGSRIVIRRGVKEIISLITESNRTQTASKARQSWNLDSWSFFSSLVSMNEFWMCLLYYTYASGQGLFRDSFLNLVERFRKRTCRVRSDFNNTIRPPLLVLSFVNTNWLQWLNKGIHSVSLHWLYSTKQNLFQKIKFRLEDTVFTNILCFQDLTLFQLAFVLVTKTPSIEIPWTSHLVILH